MVPGTCGSFEDYVNEVFVPYVMKELDTVIRIDIAWYVYKFDSLKYATREKRGCGTRCQVSSSTRIPGNWPGFLRNKENKQKLFRFFAEKCVCGPNVRPHRWTSRCRCSMALSLLQEVYRDRKHSSNSISSIRTHGESRISSRPHLESVPSRQAICSHSRWLGLGEMWWTMESCMSHITGERQGFYYKLLGCKCKKTCKGNCKCHLQCISLNHCALVMNSVMEMSYR